MPSGLPSDFKDGVFFNTENLSPKHHSHRNTGKVEFICLVIDFDDMTSCSKMQFVGEFDNNLESF